LRVGSETSEIKVLQVGRVIKNLIVFWQKKKFQLIVPYLISNQASDAYPTYTRFVTIKNELSKLPIAIQVAFWELYEQQGYLFQISGNLTVNHCEKTANTVVRVLTDPTTAVDMTDNAEQLLSTPGLYKLDFESDTCNNVHYCCILVETHTVDEYKYWCIDSDRSKYTFPLKVADGAPSFTNLQVPRDILSVILSNKGGELAERAAMRLFMALPDSDLNYKPKLVTMYTLFDKRTLRTKLNVLMRTHQTGKTKASNISWRSQGKPPLSPLLSPPPLVPPPPLDLSSPPPSPPLPPLPPLSPLPPSPPPKKFQLRL
jgi:hypothetical protein